MRMSISCSWEERLVFAGNIANLANMMMWTFPFSYFCAGNVSAATEEAIVFTKKGCKSLGNADTGEGRMMSMGVQF